MNLQDISLSTTIKNRLKFLKQSLHTWVKHDFKNIYILDWNSDDSEELKEFVSSFNDPRIILETITGSGTERFIGSVSRNIACERALSLTNPKWLFQIDSDIVLNDAIDHLCLEEGKMIFANCTSFLKFSLPIEQKYATNNTSNRDAFGTFGTCIIPAEKVFEYGYYEEKYTENNLFDAQYLKKFYINCKTDIWFFRNEISHISHSNDVRQENLEYKDIRESTRKTLDLFNAPSVPRKKYSEVEPGKLVLEP